jgi:hypothetical protein
MACRLSSRCLLLIVRGTDAEAITDGAAGLVVAP